MDQHLLPLRQGDVLITPVAAIPDGALPVERDAGRVILAYGEVTGHAHAIADGDALLVRTADDRRFLRIVGSGVAVSHEEHGAIALMPGTYEVTIQQEYEPAGARNVAD
jgi:hypothetical protein